MDTTTSSNILDQLMAEFVDVRDTPTVGAGPERCGRCGHLTAAADIAKTGPYRTCPPCTQIIRG